jgi:hypothetical protein
MSVSKLISLPREYRRLTVKRQPDEILADHDIGNEAGARRPPFSIGRSGDGVCTNAITARAIAPRIWADARLLNPNSRSVDQCFNLTSPNAPHAAAEPARMPQRKAGGNCGNRFCH